MWPVDSNKNIIKMKSNSKDRNKFMTNVSMIPPNGQYGWVIVLSYAIANVSYEEIIFKIFIFKQTVARLSYLHLFARCFFQKLSVVSLMHSSFLFNSNCKFHSFSLFCLFFSSLYTVRWDSNNEQYWLNIQRKIR